jgi:UDP-N-acetylglucosamine 2-epimerase (hydrolysing)
MRKRTRLLFITGTRADFGKLQPLLEEVRASGEFDVFLFTTGMHMLQKYGSTWEEVEASQLGRLYLFVNQNSGDSMDAILAKTIAGLSDLVKEIQPDLIVIHGDRVEALAGALVGTLSRTRVAHIEGGEVSGTVDDTLRHSISKLAHIHFTSNEGAKRRLLQMGENENTIFLIGSPEVDVMNSPDLPSIDAVKMKYGISFSDFGLLIFHPVTTELGDLHDQVKVIVDYVLGSDMNWIVIFPNNDEGTEIIQQEYARLKGAVNVRILPSMRFKYYLAALKHSRIILGNSSSGVREAPFFGTPAVNVGSRQVSRSSAQMVINVGLNTHDLRRATQEALTLNANPQSLFGDGKSSKRFLEILRNPFIWNLPAQKYFVDRSFGTENEL